MSHVNNVDPVLHGAGEHSSSGTDVHVDSRVVVSNSEVSSEGTPVNIRWFPLRELEHADPKNYQNVVKLFEQLGNKFIQRFIQQDLSMSGFYIQNVLTFNGDRERNILHDYLLNEGAAFPRDLFGFSFDTDHVHVMHSCSFASGQCKCNWRKKIPLPNCIKPGYRFRSKFSEWTPTNYIFCVIYFFINKQREREAWIQGRRQGLKDHCKYTTVVCL